MVSSLYIHIPFCLRKCCYCAFFSEPASKDQIKLFLNAICKELHLIRDFTQPKTIFIGGGTPTLLEISDWEIIFHELLRFDLSQLVEFSVESNPATLSYDKARFLVTNGVNRISIGIQSLDDNFLSSLGRIHTRKMAFDAVNTARKAGFNNLNVDLMFALPGQSLTSWTSTLSEALAFHTEHLSCYEVIYEEDTPLFQMLQSGQIIDDENLSCDMYELFLERSAAVGFHQYEIANVARHTGVPFIEFPSFACKHNINYWCGGEYEGIGPSASRYVVPTRTTNVSSINLYCKYLADNVRPIEVYDQLTPLGRAGEIAAFGLRMTSGWRFSQFQQVTGFDMRVEWKDEIQQLLQLEYAQCDSDRFKLTPKGLRFADWVGQLFLR